MTIAMYLVVLWIPVWVFTVSLHFPPTIARSIASISSIDPEEQTIAQFTGQMEAYSPGIPGVRVEHHEELNKRILVALIVASTLLVAILLLLFSCYVSKHKNLKTFKERSQQKQKQKPEESAKGLSLGPIVGRFNSLRIAGKKGGVAAIEYQLLEAATNNFHESNILGEGGFGSVYKALFDEKSHAAVKRVEVKGQDAEREFENELEWLRKIQHQNIVSTLGYCIHGEMRFLVYEMMQNGSLESQLHGHSHGMALSWHRRMKISLDVARGLEYLHERCNPPVIHRNLKSSNILLDQNFNAKLSDFGLAIASGATSKSDIKLSEREGYVAPEYLLDGKLTDKSDVYAFGVVLLELLLGRKPVEKVTPTQYQSIVTRAMPQLTDRSKLPNLVDPAIRNKMDLKHLYQVAAVAVLCVQTEPSYRPLITDVLHSLIPLVPVELGGSLKTAETLPQGHTEPSQR
ncbi:Serine-threonine/tyrosine-protein kinase, catalytic domain [Dillenia turbinata]|uniref:Serine-threonine/tyrosine-protein kinase, catalytic domain n=1 Tax=Dillenia turbinata TaxID=194707 RepID=A0AAN8UBD9_9MAGN